eukprot:TRINITY_DN105249_c0_g1_i1.p1 TRINITY_DN105249_c0_g1~~TRINITY_DN105249_c0_g1_i1.p1  ORF type:complete len:371 (+),score=57.47 TRINITY_DN105249_c0_g1_i1:101-1213(+)
MDENIDIDENIEDFDPSSLDDFFSKAACAPTSAGTRSKAVSSGVPAADQGGSVAPSADDSPGIYQHPAHRVTAKEHKVHGSGPPKRVIIACACVFVMFVILMSSSSGDSTGTNSSAIEASRRRNTTLRGISMGRSPAASLKSAPVQRLIDTAVLPELVPAVVPSSQPELIQKLEQELPRTRTFADSSQITTFALSAGERISKTNASKSELPMSTTTEGSSKERQGPLTSEPLTTTNRSSDESRGPPASKPPSTLAPTMPIAPAWPSPVVSRTQSPSALMPDGFVTVSSASVLSYCTSTQSWRQAQIVAVAIHSKEYVPGCILIQYDRYAKEREILQTRDFETLLRQLPPAPPTALVATTAFDHSASKPGP